MESDLTSFHACCLLEVGPGSVDNCDIVLFISYIVFVNGGLAAIQTKRNPVLCGGKSYPQYCLP